MSGDGGGTPNTRRRLGIEAAIEQQSSILGRAICDAQRAALRGTARTALGKLVTALDHLGAASFAELTSVGGEVVSAAETDDFDNEAAGTLIDALIERADSGDHAEVTEEDKAFLREKSAELVRATTRLANAYRDKEGEFAERCSECASNAAPRAAPPSGGAVPTSTPAPGTSGGPTSAHANVASRLSSLYDMAKLQNGGDPLPAASHPPSRLVVAVIKSFEESGELPPLAEMCPRMREARESKQELTRWAMLDEFDDAMNAVAIACCDAVGQKHLSIMTGGPADLLAAAKDAAGKPLMVGAKIQAVRSLANHVRALCCPSDDTGASYYQARRACEAAWGAFEEGLEGLTRTATHAAGQARTSVTSLPSDKKSRSAGTGRPRSGGTGSTRKRRARSISDDSSSSDEAPTPKKKKKDKKKRREKRRSSSSGSESDTS